MRKCPVVLLAVAACGRIGFDLETRTGGGGADGGGADGGSLDAAPSGPPAWVQVAVARAVHGVASDSFSLQAKAAGDVVLISLICDETQSAPTVTLTVPGWTLVAVDPVLAFANSGGGTIYETTYVATAPNTAATAASVTWSQTCITNGIELGDEFENVSSTIDAHATGSGSGSVCSADVTTAHADDMLWGACTPSVAVAAPGSGFTQGADPGVGAKTEYEATMAPAGTPETVAYANDNGTYLMEAVALAPR